MKKLADIKYIISLLLTGTMVYCVVTNNLPPEFIAIYGSIIGFYFVDNAKKGQ